MTGTLTGEIITAAQEQRRKYGCPVPVCLAQWALESNWGKVQSGKNNFFGIKARAGEPYTVRLTHEVVNGQRVAVNAYFRNFASVAECFEAHGRLLATAKAYAAARKLTGDAHAYAHALTGVYATDPAYGDKLCTIMDAGNMQIYEVPGPGGAPSKAKPAASAATVAGAGTVAVVAAAGAHVDPLVLILGGLSAGLAALNVFQFLHHHQEPHA